MGRSVSVHRDAIKVIYIDGTEYSDDFEWNYFVEDLIYLVTKKYPSFRECENWDGREVLEVLENNFSVIAVSQYNGIISVSIASDPWGEHEGLARHWTAKNVDNLARLIQKNFKSFSRIGGMSDGTSVYKPVDK